MKALLIVAHGSRRVASNDEIRHLTESLRNKASGDFGIIQCAFLELASPSIPEGIDQCVQAGAEHIDVMPYFLSAGRHVAEDIPNEVAPKQRQYPHCHIRITPYLGEAEQIGDVILAQATMKIP